MLNHASKGPVPRGRRVCSILHPQQHSKPAYHVLITHAPPLCRKHSKPEFKTSDKSLWGATKGWKPLNVTDELLLGAEEGGFAGLEVLEDVNLIESGEQNL